MQEKLEKLVQEASKASLQIKIAPHKYKPAPHSRTNLIPVLVQGRIVSRYRGIEFDIQSMYITESAR